MPVVVPVTAEVLRLKVALELPAGIVTEDGTTAALLLLTSEITIPPVGAGDVSVTVPCEEPPPLRVAGDRVRLDSAMAGLTVTVVDCETPLSVAVIVTGVALETAAAVIGNAAPRSPAAMVTLAGTAAAELLLVKVTRTVPVAIPFKVTRPWDWLRDPSDAGWAETADSAVPTPAEVDKTKAEPAGMYT